MQVTKGSGHLPPNAREKLKPGEKYIPYIPDPEAKEFTGYSILWGIVMVILFSFGATYLGLRAGQVFEAAIPIAIIAVAIAALYRREVNILENVIVQSIGAASGLVVAGSIFTIPSLFIMYENGDIPHIPDFWTIVIITILASIAGVFVIIPFRRYYCEIKHGDFPFPEAWATTEILLSGEKGAKDRGKVLLKAGIIGGIVEFAGQHLYAFSGTVDLFDKNLLSWFWKGGGDLLHSIKSKGFILEVDSTPSVLGLGYIIGFRYSAILFSGSILATLVLAPTIWYFLQIIPDLVKNHLIPAWIGAKSMTDPAAFKIIYAKLKEIFPNSIFKPLITKLYSVDYLKQHLPQDQFRLLVPNPNRPPFTLSYSDIFNLYVQNIGVGAIATAGIIGILKSFGVIWTSIKESIVGFKAAKGSSGGVVRYQRDLPIGVVLIGFFGTFLLIFIFFTIFITDFWHALFAALIAMLFTVLFTVVSAYATATIASVPVSGMTLVTLLIMGIILSSVSIAGYKFAGASGMYATLLMGGVICTAISVSGGVLTDLKIGYWLGSTPAKQQISKIIGGIIASIVVTLALFLLSSAYKFGGNQIPAPQAKLMYALTYGIFLEQNIPWIMYAIGAMIAILVELMGIPSIAFALGIYLPISINAVTFVGGLVAYYVLKTPKVKEVGPEAEKKQQEYRELAKRRYDRGSLVASGFVAGGALLGVLGTLIKVPELGQIERFIKLTDIPFKYDPSAGKWVMDYAHAGPYATYISQWVAIAVIIGISLYIYKVAMKAKKEK